MNRRSFFTKLGLAAASFAILPAATTYARKWVAPTAITKLWVPNPEWVTAPFEMAFIQHQKFCRFPLPPVRYKKSEIGELVIVPQFISL